MDSLTFQKLIHGKYVKIKDTGLVIFVRSIVMSARFFNGYILYGDNCFTGKEEKHEINGSTFWGIRNKQEFAEAMSQVLEIVEKPKILDTEIFKALVEG